jgi:selenocysteine-specific elongation factor
MSARDASALFDYLGTKSAIVLEESFARLPEHSVVLTSSQEERIRRFQAELAAHPFAPPALDELCGRHEIDEEVLAVLVARGHVTRLTDSIAFSGEAVADIRNRVIERIHSAGSINVAELRDLLDTTRKYALALMEYFDQQRVTRRVGDTRVLR